MEVPAQVKATAQDLINMYGDSFDYLGEYEGAETYLYRFPDDIDTGFPFVYLLKDGKVEEISGFLAFDIIGSFVKNADEIKVE